MYSDIPAHAYQFNFANNPNWSRFYAEGGEIHEYLKDVAWKYDVEKYVRFRHRFESAEWNETDHKWIITLKDLETQQVKIDIADVLLKGTGNLNQWDWPEIPGLHDFQGPYMHSAKWDETFDWTDKTVALLGAGSSGIQILPKIQPKAKRVVHFVRNKMWISPVGVSKDEPDNVIHTEEQKNLFAEDPGAYLAYRHKIEAGINQVALVTMRDTEIQKHFWTLCQASMKEKLKKKPWLYEAMCPGSAYPPGCRRITPGPGYLEALVEDNVEVVNTGVSRVTETGLYDDNGDFHEVDAIIYATGFN
ncbi:hypothetical protein LTR84_010564 [Exophiala bonariae]|uniref:FAD/NAD(P)-binding domain-containing protein n=1 Tax=Exophiala bonariae TaxID=1690606 RepID=A0AAV9MVP5_9EURO|nr:hypothetical protein LTR84_010564 [Exophiala bonariae]